MAKRLPLNPSSEPRAWQRMLSGRRLDILTPSPLDVEIEDIAHGLARVARWNGQTKGRYGFSVAQHSVLVEHILGCNIPNIDQKWQLASLLHDAPEFVIGDMITPFKSALDRSYKDVEDRLQKAVHIRFGLPSLLPPQIQRYIKKADKMAAYIEATQLAGFSESEAKKLFSGARGTPANITLVPLPADEAEKKFLRRFELLFGKGVDKALILLAIEADKIRVQK